ncbi:MAG TPA: sigma-70 family RNA polymerase sigma factor [Baekduia sp.]|nr:sigma-70 family RNA polymerase sigma factor [Baekduia sp.]
MASTNPADTFSRLFGDHERAVLAYALRRAARPEDAADIVAETFLVAWRRLDKVPPGDAARLWLYGVARRQLANQRRGQLRRSQLADRLRQELAQLDPTHAQPPDDRVQALIAALARLSDQDREILRLEAWEGLTPAEIATVTGMRPVTVRSRLHRARKRLRAEVLRHDHTALDVSVQTFAVNEAAE